MDYCDFHCNISVSYLYNILQPSGCFVQVKVNVLYVVDTGLFKVPLDYLHNRNRKHFQCILLEVPVI